jgi:putative transposase
LPRDFPPWETVYWWFRRWRIVGTFEGLNATLREQLVKDMNVLIDNGNIRG